MDTSKHNTWKNDEKANNFLDHIRHVIPFAKEQIEIILKIIKTGTKKVEKILDVGCGDGILGRSIWKIYNKADIVFSDMSEFMISKAKECVKEDGINTSVTYHNHNMASDSWSKELADYGPYDVIISGLAIHHLTHSEKKRIYSEIYDLLNLGGIFLNLESVEAHSSLGDILNQDYFMDNLYNFMKKKNKHLERTEMVKYFMSRPDKDYNILAPVEMQTKWLRELGFVDVDIFFKIFKIAIFGGKKRSNKDY